MASRTDTFDNLTSLNPAEMLEALQAHPFLSPYALALYCESRGLFCSSPSPSPLLGMSGQSVLCDELCRTSHENILAQAINRNEPMVYRCKTGLLNFIVPFKLSRSQTCCLLGGGVRDSQLNTPSIEVLAREKNLNGLSLIEELERLPTSTEEELRAIAEKTAAIIPALQSGNLYALAFERTMLRLNAIIGLVPELDRAASAEQVLHLVGEALAVLFDLSRAAVVLPTGADKRPMLCCLGQWLSEPAALNDEQLALLLRPAAARRYVLEDEDALKRLPGVKGERVFCQPLSAEGRFLGTLALFDVELAQRDLLLVELLASRAALRLLRLEKEREQALEAAIAAQIIEMIGDLSLLDRREALFARILDLSAELLRASKGSLMILDEDGEHLYIEASKGMNPELARSMKVRVGSGIAGRVVSSGHPLLVNDIEKDERVRSTNRPRFRTKSFISVPLKVRGEIFAVLNLSDKENQATFDEPDLRMLCSFAPHFSALIERTESLERAAALEELSVTDPLTGLYNRRFLERRLEEEISRSLRQELSLTLIMVDLDNFKHYNDLCGHLGGDKALKRTARLLRHSAREMDIVTRFGGEEFCILLPATSKKESLLVAERIRHAIEKEIFPREKDLPLGKLTASMGIASFPADGNTPRALVNAADMALYRAKSEGRNRTILYDLHDRLSKVSTA
ncbi:diguanylate cyclase [Geoalkalibacter sp.]|uniref:diguanylate cyclase n=1 Tax=Geoalkalibacter sp. TaxID=3041440 RepID=UPI00272E992A|nr:diguanylate cyclase [Geoalkalibacter sp.]